MKQVEGERGEKEKSSFSNLNDGTKITVENKAH